MDYGISRRYGVYNIIPGIADFLQGVFAGKTAK